MPRAPERQLTLLDSTCLIVGIIVGVGIYQMAPTIAGGMPGAVSLLALWAVGGLLSLCGALGYAELASAYPREGGDYVFLTRAYGPWAGFLFGWIQLTVVRPGDIAIVAFAFATYARVLIDPQATDAHGLALRLYACAAVVVMTAINVAGVRAGKGVQNALTILKIAGLLAIVGVAVAAPAGGAAVPRVDSVPPHVALIMVLFTFGGWNEMAYVAAEVRDPRRNIARALVLGTVAVTALYLAVNAALLYTLGYAGLTASKAVAVDAIATVFADSGGRIIAALVCVSALGAVNGLVFTGARISYAVGADHRAFRVLGRWDARTGTPVRSLVAQGAIAAALVLALGSFIETVLYYAAVVYAFYLATSVAVIVLRFREPYVERPFRVPLYPVPTLVFAAVCGFLIYGAVTYKPVLSATAFGLVLLGLPVYWLTRGRALEPRP